MLKHRPRRVEGHGSPVNEGAADRPPDGVRPYTVHGARLGGGKPTRACGRTGISGRRARVRPVVEREWSSDGDAGHSRPACKEAAKPYGRACARARMPPRAVMGTRPSGRPSRKRAGMVGARALVPWDITLELRPECEGAHDVPSQVGVAGMSRRDRPAESAERSACWVETCEVRLPCDAE